MSTIESALQPHRQLSHQTSFARLAVPSLFFAVVMVHFVVQLVPVTRGVPYIASHLTKDDTYYCLETAWNLRHLGVPSFDGLHRTNGVQFLWFWMVVGVSYLAADKETLLSYTMLLCVILNVAAYIPMWKIGRLLKRPGLALLLALAWCHVNLHNGVMLYGLDASVHALVFWCVVYEIMRLILNKSSFSDLRLQLIPIAILFSLLVWARIDSVFLVVPLYAYVVWHFRGDTIRKTLSFAWPSAAVAAGAALVLFCGYFWMAGFPLPVSGLIKQHYHEWFSIDTSAIFRMALRGLPVVDVWKDTIPWSARTPIAWGILVWLAVSALVALRPTVYMREVGLAKLGSVYALLVAASFVQLYYWSGLRVFKAAPWYQGVWYVLCVLTVAFWIDGLIHWSRSLSHFRWVVAVPIMMIGILVGSCIATCTAGRLPWHKERELYTQRLAAARWMSSNLQPDAICAAWNAGQLGYFSKQRLINLDGLINSYEYYRDVRFGTKSLRVYFAENDVQYVVDYAVPAKAKKYSFLNQCESIASFPVPSEDKVVQVWRVPRAAFVSYHSQD